MSDPASANQTQGQKSESKPLARSAPGAERAKAPEPGRGEPVFNLGSVSIHYGGEPAVTDVSFDIYENRITALIGPSGAGKSTLLRSLNRMIELVPDAAVAGEFLYRGDDLYGQGVDPVEVRKRIGMVFQHPNPFPRSIYDNVAFGPRLFGQVQNLDERVEATLRRSGLWDEVKDRLRQSALGLSGGQQQRLCIARALASEPDVLLMDEPCSALDPISTQRIEDLMVEMRERYSIVIVTHNMQQAARVSDMTACMTVEPTADRQTTSGQVIEYADTETIFTNPSDPRTEAYVTGRVG